MIVEGMWDKMDLLETLNEGPSAAFLQDEEIFSTFL